MLDHHPPMLSKVALLRDAGSVCASTAARQRGTRAKAIMRRSDAIASMASWRLRSGTSVGLLMRREVQGRAATGANVPA